MSSYTEKFKDPRWQKKRLQILEESDFGCQNCGDKDQTLHVHHKFYTKGKAPWDYDDDCLFVFCETCHSDWHRKKAALDVVLGDLTIGDQLDRIHGYALAMSTDVFPQELDGNAQKICGYADAFRTTVDAVRDIIKKAREKTGGSAPISPIIQLFRQMI